MFNESLNVCVLGLGKVGLPLASYLGWRGHKVYGFDTNPDITKRLMAGENTLPWEPRIHLEKITIRDSLEDALEKSELVYIIVPTPLEGGKRLSSEFVRRAREGVEKHWSGTIIIGSTLDPRDAGDVCDASHVVYNPPLIRLGHVFEDLRDMQVLLIGQRAAYAQRWVEWLWMHNARVVVGDPESIAVAKLAINVSLSMRIAWANELAEVCQRYRVSDKVVLDAVGADPRLGRGYLGAGWPPAGPCFVPGTLVFTRRGPVAIELICVGDSVLGHDGRFHPVTKAHGRMYSGSIYVVQPLCGLPVGVTPDHRVLGSKRREGGSGRYKNNHLVPPKTSFDEPQWIEASRLHVGDYLATHRVILDAATVPISLMVWPPRTPVSSGETIPLDEDLAWMIGIYLAEGFPGNKSAWFSLHANERSIADRIVDIAKKKFDCGSRIVPRGERNIRVGVYSVALRQFLVDFCGRGSARKKIDPSVMVWPSHFQKALVSGVFLGDGSFSGGRMTHTTTSIRLWGDIQILLRSFGVPFGVRIAHEHVGADGTHHNEAYYLRIGRGTGLRELSEWYGPSVGGRDIRRVAVSGPYIFAPIFSQVLQAFRGKVYNLEVEESESYCIVGGITAHNCLPRDLEVWSQLGSPMAEVVRTRHEMERDERVRSLMSTISAAGTPRLAILGLVYKAGAVDCTETLGIHVAREAQRRGWAFWVYDPAQFYLPQSELEGFPLAVSAEAAIREATDVVITADWSEFKGLDMSGKCVHNLGDR